MSDQKVYWLVYAGSRGLCDYGRFVSCEKRHSWVDAMEEGLVACRASERAGERVDGRLLDYDVLFEKEGPIENQEQWDAWCLMRSKLPVNNVYD